MAQIDKIQVSSSTYDVAQSASATFTGTSNDTSSPSGWTTVNTLASGETNGSIFTKISKMFANIRWLYKQLGTTDYSATGASTVSAALSALQSGKAASSHSHTVANLPVTDQQNNSSSTIPTSALIYSMNQTLTSLNDAYNKKSFGAQILINDDDVHIASSDGIIVVSFGWKDYGYIYVNIDQYQFFSSSNKGVGDSYGISNVFPIRKGMVYQKASNNGIGKLLYIPFV